jgi:hypothetical protein
MRARSACGWPDYPELRTRPRGLHDLFIEILEDLA